MVIGFRTSWSFIMARHGHYYQRYRARRGSHSLLQKGRVVLNPGKCWH